MDDFVRSIFEGAMIREEASYKLYKGLSERTDNQQIKLLLVKLAEEEKIHEMLLSKMNLDVLAQVNKLYLTDLSLIKKESLDILSGADIKDINEILDFAIRREQESYDDYSRIALHLPSGKPRAVFGEIAKQEAGHKLKLTKIKLELNDADWRKLE